MRAAFPHRRNFALLLLLECLWAFGTWLAHPMTVMPDFLLRLGAGPATVALLPALWALGTGAGALVVGTAAAHRGRLAPFAGALHLAAAAPWIALAAIAAAAGAGRLSPRDALVLALAAVLAFDLLIGFVLQIYFTLLARAFPERGRGRWFGWLFALAGLTGLAGPPAASSWLGGGAGLAGYARIFAAAFACFAVGTVPIFFLVERPGVPERARSLRVNAAALLAAWRGRGALRRYLTARMWLEPAVLVGASLATYARDEAGCPEALVTRLGSLVVAAEAGASLALGWLSGRLERSRARARAAYLTAQWVAQAAAVGALAFAALGPARRAVPCLAVACGLRVAADFVIHPNVLLEMGPRRTRTDLLAVGAVALMPALLLVPPAGGLAIDALGHRAAFGLAALAGGTGLVLLGRECARA